MLELLFARNHSSMDYDQRFDREDSSHRQHVLPPCLVQNKHHRVGWDDSRCLGHKHSQDFSATEHLIPLPLARTILPSVSEMELLDSLVLLRAEK